MSNAKFGPLTAKHPVGTMKEGGEGHSPEPKKVPKEPDNKFRRPEGPMSSFILELLLKLHTFARDWNEVADENEASLLAAMLDELAAVLKAEYDRLHG